MKTYTVFTADENFKYLVDECNKTHRELNEKCKSISELLNYDYKYREVETEFGELHSISQIGSDDIKQYAIVLEKEVNNVIFILQNKTEVYRELSNKAIKYMNDFKKIILDETEYRILNIMYNIDDDIIIVELDN